MWTEVQCATFEEMLHVVFFVVIALAWLIWRQWRECSVARQQRMPGQGPKMRFNVLPLYFLAQVFTALPYVQQVSKRIGQFHVFTIFFPVLAVIPGVQSVMRNNVITYPFKPIIYFLIELVSVLRPKIAIFT